MSLQFLHESALKALEAEAARLAQQAIQMRAAIGLPADQYALVQCQTLAQAYGLTQAMQIVTREYKKLTEPPEKKDDAANDTQPTARRPIYG